MILLLGFFLVARAVGEDVMVTGGDYYEFSLPPLPSSQKQQRINYNFKTTPGEQIKLYCDDFRIRGQKGCESFSFTIIDGSTRNQICNPKKQKIGYQSQGSSLTVEMVYKSEEMVSCVVRSTQGPEPQEIVLDPVNSEYSIEKTERRSYTDQAWIIKSASKQKISISCWVSLLSEVPCLSDFLVVDDGNKRHEFCDRAPEVSLSTVEGKDMKIRLALDKMGWGALSCTLRVPNQEDLDAMTEPTPIEKDVFISPGSTHSLTVPRAKYVKSMPWFIYTYNVRTAPDRQIALYCYHLDRLAEPTPCETAGIAVNDGITSETICGEENEKILFSSGPSMTIDFRYKYEIPSYCDVLSADLKEKVTESFLGRYEKAVSFNNPKEAFPFMRRTWKFTSSPEMKISLKCELYFRASEACKQESFVVDTGSKKETFCADETIVLFSRGNSLSVNVRFDRHGSANYRCVAQAVTGPYPDQKDNMLNGHFPKIDSSEHGGRPGRVGTTCKCGWRNYRPQQRIFHGKETKISEYPWIVGIRDENNGQRCGGSIITKFHVLTAAHCMTDSTRIIKKTVVALGAHHIENDSPHNENQHIPVVQVFIPEEWLKSVKDKNYDISVLLLKNEIKFGQFVGPVCLPPVSPKLVNKEIKITGWGITEKEEASPVLLETDLVVIDRDICGMTENFICSVKKNTTVCYGDSGSPFVDLDNDTNRYAQVSVVSFGNRNCDFQYNGSSNVTFHYNWIADIIMRTKPEVHACTKIQ